MFGALFLAGVLAAAISIGLKLNHAPIIAPGIAPLPSAEERALTGATSSTKFVNPQGVETFVRVWETDEGSKGRGTVLLVHGFSWHSQYWTALASALTSAGFRVVGYDLQGHGRSGTVSGAKGYATRFDDWVREMREVITAHAIGQGKLFIHAESMGATIVLRALTGASDVFQYKDEVKGVVFSGPVIRVAPEVLPPPPVVAVIKALATIFPLLSVPSSEVADGFEGAFGDKEFAKLAKKDPLVIFDSPRLRSAAEILGTVAKNNEMFSAVTQPILVLHGQDDKRTHAANSVDFINGISSANKRLEIIPGANHQLLQDKKEITDKVIAQVVEFFSGL